jgi:hypothetical protein
MRTWASCSERLQGEPFVQGALTSQTPAEITFSGILPFLGMSNQPPSEALKSSLAMAVFAPIKRQVNKLALMSLSSPLVPAFAEAASRRQAPGARESLDGEGNCFHYFANILVFSVICGE